MLVGRFVGRLVNQLGVWLVGEPVIHLGGCSLARSGGWLVIWLIGWSVRQLFDRSVSW